MQINRENLKKSRGWILKYILIVVAVIAAPLIGKGIAPLFDHVALTWGGKAELRGLFAELTTTLTPIPRQREAPALSVISSSSRQPIWLSGRRRSPPLSYRERSESATVKRLSS
jgi:hypothetical protein